MSSSQKPTLRLNSQVVSSLQESSPSNLITLPLRFRPYNGPAKKPKPFRFMDLPAELRVKVYKIALIQSEPISVGIYKHDANSGAREKEQHQLDYQVDHYDRLNFSQDSSLSRLAAYANYLLTPPREPLKESSSGIPVALLQTCKIIHREARPILYGANTFQIPMKPAHGVLEGICLSRTHIKTLIIAMSERDGFHNFLNLCWVYLRYFRALKSLTLDWSESASSSYRSDDPTHRVENDSLLARVPQGRLDQAMVYLPVRTEVKLKDGNISQVVDGKRDVGHLDQVIEDAVQRMIEEHNRALARSTA